MLNYQTKLSHDARIFRHITSDHKNAILKNTKALMKYMYIHTYIYVCTIVYVHMYRI